MEVSLLQSPLVQIEHAAAAHAGDRRKIGARHKFHGCSQRVPYRQANEGATDNALLLEAPQADLPALQAKLRRYKLGSPLELKDISSAQGVYAVLNDVPLETPRVAPEPRLAETGYRMLRGRPLTARASATDYSAPRDALGPPDGAPVLEPEKTLLLKTGFAELTGVAWDKGCYMGQELTARTKYRGLVKRQLLPLAFTVPAPAPGTPVTTDGQEAGNLRSCGGGWRWPCCAWMRWANRPLPAEPGSRQAWRNGCSGRAPQFSSG